jgi:Rhodanese-related sulfurtransferase
MDNNIGPYIVIAAVAGLFVFQKLRNRKASTAVIKEKLGMGAKIIDVRSPGEFSSGAYPKAKNIPLDRIESRMGELSKDKPLVLYCASGARSAQAVRILKRAGFSDVVSAGGLANMPR